LLYFLLAVILIPGILFSLLNSNAIQTYLAQQAAEFFSKELKTKISIKKLSISPFFNIIAEDVLVNDRHNNKMFYTKAVILDFGDISFAKHHINFEKAIIEKPYIALVRYRNEEELNFKFLADYFSSSDTSTSVEKSNWKYKIDALKLLDAHFIYQLDSKDTAKSGIDFNHINLSELNTDIRDINIIGDTIRVDIANLTFKDRSGFNVKSMQTILSFTPSFLSFNNTKIITPDSELNFNLSFNYKNFNNDMNEFFSKVDSRLTFNQSRLNLKDLAYFVHDLAGMNLIINISADFKGKLNNLKGKNLVIKAGNSTYFKGSLAMTGLPVVNETFINADIQEFYSTRNDVQSIRLPDQSGGHYIKFPDELISLGNIRYKGKFTGFLNDFVSYGNLYTDIGMLTTDIRLKNDTENGVISYNGKIGAENFNIGKLLSKEEILGNVSLDATIAGSGFDFNKANITIEGIIKSVDLNQYTYQNVDIKGKFGNKTFNGAIHIDDQNIGLSFNGLIDLSADIPQFHLAAEIQNADFVELNLLKSDSVKDFSTSVSLDFKGNKLDNFFGNIEISNTSFTKSNKKFAFGYLNISNFIDSKGDMVNKIDADFIHGEVKGIKSFAGLQNNLFSLANSYLPSLKLAYNDSVADTLNKFITFSLAFKKTDSILKLLLPTLRIADNTTISGVFQPGKKKLNFQFSSPYIEYNKLLFQNIEISGKSENKHFIFSNNCSKVVMTDTIYVDNLNILSEIHHDSIEYVIQWHNESQNIKNTADISGECYLSKYPSIEIILNESNIIVRDSLLAIKQGNRIVIDTSAIMISNLFIGNNTQQIIIDGNISDIAADKINITFMRFNLSNLDAFTAGQKIDVDGTLDGNVVLSDLYFSPNVLADITIKNFAFNREFIGDAIIKSSWDNYQKALVVNAEVGYTENEIFNKPIEIAGKYFPNQKENNLDFIINISKFRLDPLGKFLSSFASGLTGFASGTIALKGSDSQPELSGVLNFAPARLKIDYLNTVYYFSEDVTFDRNSISFDEVMLVDEHEKTAKLNGKIYHNNFSDWGLSLSILAKNFYCMNTTIDQNSSFYGKAYITGLTKIYGTAENINIDVVAKTDKGTQLYIPVSDNSEISDYPYISFVSNNLSVSSKNNDVDLSGMKMNFDLEVTSDAEVQIIFDSKSGDILKAKGTGNMKLEITTLGDFNMYGDYLIDKGDYLFTVKNIFTKHFDIVKGGTISWNGDPFDATINLSPVYKLRTSLYDLYNKSNPNIQDPDTSKKRVPVECVINMTDKLFNPAISFDIDFPSLNDNARQEYRAVVKPEINNQFLSLLIMNKFISPSQDNTTSSENNVIGSTTSELLSNQLNNWLSQISNDFDLGVNYRAGDEMNSDELEVALSTQLFNDRLIIDGNVGTSGGNSQSSSSIVGDVNIEYKWTDEGRFRIKAFNKSNEIDILTPNSTYTQGVGIFYRKEFDSFRDLFTRKKKKKKK